MKERPLRTTVIGSYPLPAWLEYAADHLNDFGSDDLEEIQTDAVTCAVSDQLAAGLDCITDGEQTRLDFNLSFYGYLEGIERQTQQPRRFGPPAHDQRGKHEILGSLQAPRGLGVVEEFQRLQTVVAALPLAARPALKASVPGPYTLSGRLVPNKQYPDRYSVTEALLPIVSRELERLVEAGCKEIAVDEPSMSCYAHREDAHRLVQIFNQTTASVFGKARLSTHLCFGNYKGRAVGPRSYRPLFPAFLELRADEVHLEMASREFSELDVIAPLAERTDVVVGIVDVKSYYIETPEDIADRVRACLRYAPPESLSFAPDCGLSQTARWAASRKLANLVRGVTIVRKEIDLQ